MSGFLMVKSNDITWSVAQDHKGVCSAKPVLDGLQLFLLTITWETRRDTFFQIRVTYS